LTLLLAGAALWLFLAAIPALADGGPHVAANNSGTSTLTADGCAGCHRAHTAQGPLLLKADGNDLCLSCHGATGTGATTDVESGVQYAVGTTDVRGTNVLGALRGGGFVDARIDAANPVRVAYLSGTGATAAVRQSAKVPVLGAGQPVTSAHIALVGATGVSATHKAWGNGALNSGAGPTVDLECATCHNPHGNGMYRILNPVPNPTVTAGTFTAVAAPGVSVTDAADPTNATRNYTVIQVKGPSYLLLASDVTTAGYGSTTGDYLHRKLPWNGTSGTANDAPNGLPISFDAQMNAWCASCHTRYNTSSNLDNNPSAITYPSGSGPYDTTSGDALYTYRHSTTSNKPCTTCHVSHGSNAVMDGAYSSTFPYPDGTTAPSSRLLKAGNRGTCQLCHDPTGTITAGTVLPPGADAVTVP
jgi:predicted CXXCH cytochrome family protein